MCKCLCRDSRRWILSTVSAPPRRERMRSESKEIRETQKDSLNCASFFTVFSPQFLRSLQLRFQAAFDVFFSSQRSGFSVEFRTSESQDRRSIAKFFLSFITERFSLGRADILRDLSDEARKNRDNWNLIKKSPRVLKSRLLSANETICSVDRVLLI